MENPFVTGSWQTHVTSKSIFKYLVRKSSGIMSRMVCVDTMSLNGTQLALVALDLAIAHSRPKKGIVFRSCSVIVVITSGVTLLMLIEATISEHLMSGSNDVYLKTRCP